MSFLPGFETEETFLNSMAAAGGCSVCSGFGRCTKDCEAKQLGDGRNVSNVETSKEPKVVDGSTDDVTSQPQSSEDNTLFSELDVPDWSTFESTFPSQVGIQHKAVETETQTSSPSKKRKRDDQDGAAVHDEEVGRSEIFEQEQYPRRKPATLNAVVGQRTLKKNIRDQEPPAGRKRKNLATSHRVAAKGDVQESFGILQVRDVENFIWRNAGYHNDYRAEFIEMDRAEHRPYVHQPQRGDDEYDVTSLCSSNSTWTPDKETVRDSQGRKILCVLEQPEDYYPQEPRVWMHKGLVMLDMDNHPIREFSNVPRTLSSEIEGWRMEGLRRTTGMTITDMIARMPTYRKKKDGKIEQLQTKPAFTNRMMRWRKDHGVPVWKEAAGSKSIKDYTLQKLHAQNPEATSTEGFSGFSEEQRREVRNLNKDKYGCRSRYEQSGPEVVTPRSANDPALTEHSSIDNMAPSRNNKRKGAFDENEESVVQKKQRLQPQLPLSMGGFDSMVPSASNKRRATFDEPDDFTYRKKQKLQPQPAQLPLSTNYPTFQEDVSGCIGPPDTNYVDSLSTTKNKQPGESFLIDLGDFDAAYRSESTPQRGGSPDQAYQEVCLRDEEEEMGKVAALSTSVDESFYQDYNALTEDSSFDPNSHLVFADVGPSTPTWEHQSTQAPQSYGSQEVTGSRDSANVIDINPSMVLQSHFENTEALTSQAGSVQTNVLQYPNLSGSHSTEDLHRTNSHALLPPPILTPHVPQEARRLNRSVPLPRDYRSYKPYTEKEADSVLAALEYTRTSFRNWHDVDAPPTSRFKSYQVQFEELRAVHESLWQFVDPVEPLIGLGYWTGKFDNWRLAQIV